MGPLRRALLAAGCALLLPLLTRPAAAAAPDLFSAFSAASERLLYALDTETSMVELEADPQGALEELDALLRLASSRLREVAASAPAELARTSYCDAYYGSARTVQRTVFRRDASAQPFLSWDAASLVLPPGFEEVAAQEFLSARVPLEGLLLELAQLLPQTGAQLFVSALDGVVAASPAAPALRLSEGNGLRTALASRDARFLPAFRAHMSFGRVLLLVDGSTYYTESERELIRQVAVAILRLLSPSNFVRLMFVSRTILPFSDTFLWLDRHQEEMERFVSFFDFDARDLGRRLSTSSLTRALNYGLFQGGPDSSEASASAGSAGSAGSGSGSRAGSRTGSRAESGGSRASRPGVRLTIVVSGGMYFDAPARGGSAVASKTNLVFLQIPLRTGLADRGSQGADVLASRAADFVSRCGGSYAQLEAGQDALFFDYLSAHEDSELRTPGDLDCHLERTCAGDPYCVAPGFVNPANDLPRLSAGVPSRDMAHYISTIVDAISPFMQEPRVRYTFSRGGWADDSPALVLSYPVHARLRFRRLGLVGVLAITVRPAPDLARLSAVLFREDGLAVWPGPDYCEGVDLDAENALLDSRGHYSLLRLNSAIGKAVRLRGILWGSAFRALVSEEGGLCPSVGAVAVRTTALPFDPQLSLAVVTPVAEALFASLPSRRGTALADPLPSDLYLPGGSDEGRAAEGALFFRVGASRPFGSPAPGLFGQCAALAWAKNATCEDVPQCPCISTESWEPSSASSALPLGFYTMLSAATRALAGLGPEEPGARPPWGLAVRGANMGLAVATYPLPEGGDAPAGAAELLLAGAGQPAPDPAAVAALQRDPAGCYVRFQTELSMPHQGVEVPIAVPSLAVRLDVLGEQLGSPAEGETRLLLSASGVVLASRRAGGPAGLTGYTLLNHEELVGVSVVLEAAGALGLNPLEVRFSALPPGRQYVPNSLRGELVLLRVVEGAALFSSTLSGSISQPSEFSAGAGAAGSADNVTGIIVPSSATGEAGGWADAPSRAHQLADQLALKRTQYTPSVFRQACLGKRLPGAVDYGVISVSVAAVLALLAALLARIRPGCPGARRGRRKPLSAPRPAAAPAGSP